MIFEIQHPSEKLHANFDIETIALVLPNEIKKSLVAYTEIFKSKYGSLKEAISSNEFSTILNYFKQKLFDIKIDFFCSNILNIICNHSGCAVIKNFPYENETNDVEIAYFIFSCYLGNPTANNRDGIRVWPVIPKQIDSSKQERTNERHGNSGTALNFHTDTSTFSGLLCIKQAHTGGENELISTVAVHNIIYRKNKELLKTLYFPFYIDRRGEQLDNDLPYAELPVFGVSVKGTIKTHWAKPYLYAAYDKYNLPALNDIQKSALELLIDTINQVALTTKVVIKSEPGDILIVNNNLIFHNRREFYGDRCLLRIWLYATQPEAFPHMFGYPYE